MNRNPFLLLTSAFVINGIFFIFNASAACMYANDAPMTSQMEAKDVSMIKKNLTDQTKKDIQKWDSLFDSVQVGKTTKAEIFQRFVNLHEIYNSYANTKIYVFDYSFSLPESHLYDDIFNSGDSLKGILPNLSFPSDRNLLGRGSTQSYYSEYKFTINESTKLVRDKEKNFMSVSAGTAPVACLKPVIYFYPLKEQKVSVRLNYSGNITVSYPQYDSLIKGWNIKAYPDGKIINMSDQEEYSYIFWEGSPTNVQYDMSEGFIVEGEKSEEFLRETLKKMGLKPREYNEFIVYWYPKLKNNKYNLIHFAHEEYEKIAPLEITPKPDSLLRVFMVYKPLTEKIEVKPQEIKPFVRTGFTVIEWGGTALTQERLVLINR